MKKNGDDDTPSNVIIDSDSVHVTGVASAVTYDITLSEHIVHSSKSYFELLNIIYGAGQEDLLRLRMGNFGGSLQQCIRLCNALKHCKATLVIYLDTSCYSAGAIISLCGDSLHMMPGTMLMFHNYSGGEHGKAGEVRASVEAHNKLFKRALNAFCYPFLSRAEINKLCSDQDIYIYDDDKDLEARKERHYK